MRQTRFKDLDLTDSNFTHSNLAGATFEHCTLVGVDFSVAQICGCTFIDCDMAKTTFDDAILFDHQSGGVLFLGCKNLDAVHGSFVKRVWECAKELLRHDVPADVVVQTLPEVIKGSSRNSKSLNWKLVFSKLFRQYA